MRVKSLSLFLGIFILCSGVAGDSVSKFQALADHRPAVRQSYGIRYARPLSANQVELLIGHSATSIAGQAEAYRIISFDDPQYPYPKFIRAKAAKATKSKEAAGVAGAPFQSFDKTVVVLDLPFPLKAGKTYHILAQGVGGSMVTAAKCAGSFKFTPGKVPPVPDNKLDLAVMGLRKIEPVGAGVIMLEFGANFATGPGTQAGSYQVKINGQPVQITQIGRWSMVDCYYPTGWPFKALPVNQVFLQLGKPFKDGDKITVTANPTVSGGNRTATLNFKDKGTLSNALKVNQIGYITDSPVKVAYLGRWLGSFPEGGASLPGGAALYFSQAPDFNVCELRSGKVVHTAKSKLIHKSGTMNEGVYKHDHSGENVYLLDFTEFKKPGKYFISVGRVGRSLPFSIADDVYDKAFQVQAHGTYVERCGIELGPPYTQWRRIPCHNKGLTVTKVSRIDGGEFLGAKGKKPKLDPQYPKPLPAFGGHHDAGDYNPRSHIDVAQNLMNAYEIAPQKFFDGQSNIPEKKNGIPDLLDEAYWAIRLWLGLQDKDGGVFNGTESNGDPNFIQSVDLDVLGDYAYKKDTAGSFIFAGTLAQASRVWRSLGKTKEADDFLKRAEKAYTWGKAHKPSNFKDERNRHRKWDDPLAYAAAQLLHTTGKAKYNDDFKQVAAWVKNPGADIEQYKKYDQKLAAFAYAQCPKEIVDPALQENVKKAIINRAEMKIKHCSTMAYAFIRHPWAPINWGTGALCNWLNPIIWAWSLTGDEKYRYWIVRTCDNALGANPMNQAWIVGAGTRTVRAPLHNSRYSHMGEVVDGIQVEGPHYAGAGYRVQEIAYPKLRKDFASLYTYADCHFCIAMNEGVVPAYAKALAAFGLLLPDRQK